MARQTEVIESVKRIARVSGLGVGDKLPSVRTLSRELGCGHVTVAQAYKALGEEGYVQSRKKLGTTIVKDLGSETAGMTYRIIVVEDVNGLHGISSPQETNLFRDGLKQSLGKLELMRIQLDSRHDGLDELMDIVCYHYKYRESSNNNTVFLLSHCPKWIKSFFQQEGIPCIVHGGVEPGIFLPSICGSVPVTMAKLVELLDSHEGYPVTFLQDYLPIGMHYYFFEEFRRLTEIKGTDDASGGSLQLSDADDIAEGQIAQLLKSSRPPRTLVVQNDETGLKVVRMCMKKGVAIPEQVKIITLQTSSIGQNVIPSIAGFYYDYGVSGRKAGEMVKDSLAGKENRGKQVSVPPIFISRESFPI